MRKTDKKRDNALRRALTNSCETALKAFDGFRWLTHSVNFDDFPASLSILCVFETNAQLSKILACHQVNELRTIIRDDLSMIDVAVTDICQHVSFDTEENCSIENNGRWRERLK